MTGHRMQASALLTGRAMKLAAMVCSLLLSLTALADVANLDSGLPIEIEDARPIERGEKALQLITRWERQRSGGNLFVVEPQFQWGFAARSQVALTLHRRSEERRVGKECRSRGSRYH